MMDATVSRRTVLRGALASLGTLGSTGCLSTVDGDPSYANWLYPPGAFGMGGFYHPHVYHLDRIVDRTGDGGQFFSDLSTLTEGYLDPFDVDLTDVVSVVTTDAYRVFRTPRKRSELLSSVSGDASQHQTSTNGARLFVGADGVREYAVGDGFVVSGHSLGEPLDSVRYPVEAVSGERPTYAEEDESVAEAVSALGQQDYVSLRPDIPEAETDPRYGQFEGEVVEARGLRYRSDAIWGRFVLVFEDAADVDLDAIRTWTEQTDVFSDWRGLRIAKRGRSAVLDVKTDYLR
jgi:hypothetical protein